MKTVKVLCKRKYWEFTGRDNLCFKFTDNVTSKLLEDYSQWLSEIFGLNHISKFKFIREVIATIFFIPSFMIASVIMLSLSIFSYKTKVVFIKNKLYDGEFDGNTYYIIGANSYVKIFYLEKEIIGLPFSTFFYKDNKELRKEKLKKLK